MALIDKLNAIGDAIRSKTGKTSKLTLDEMANEIENIVANPILQSKRVTPNVYAIQVIADEGYDGLHTVTVEKIPEQYIIPIGDIVITSNGTYDVTDTKRAIVNVAMDFDHSVEDSLVTRGLTSYTNDRIKSVGGQAFWGCSSLTEVCLPNVEALATNSFRACTKLVKVDLGSKARTINSNAFYGCTKLNAVIIRSESVCSCTTSTFADTPIEDGTGFVYVPSALVESYKAASNWKNFNIRAIENFPEITA